MYETTLLDYQTVIDDTIMLLETLNIHENSLSLEMTLYNFTLCICTVLLSFCHTN